MAVVTLFNCDKQKDNITRIDKFNFSRSRKLKFWGERPFNIKY